MFVCLFVCLSLEARLGGEKVDFVLKLERCSGLGIRRWKRCVCVWGGGGGAKNVFVEIVVGLHLPLAWLIFMDEYIEWIRAQ